MDRFRYQDCLDDPTNVWESGSLHCLDIAYMTPVWLFYLFIDLLLFFY